MVVRVRRAQAGDRLTVAAPDLFHGRKARPVLQAVLGQATVERRPGDDVGAGGRDELGRVPFAVGLVSLVGSDGAAGQQRPPGRSGRRGRVGIEAETLESCCAPSILVQDDLDGALLRIGEQQRLTEVDIAQYSLRGPEGRGGGGQNQLEQNRRRHDDCALHPMVAQHRHQLGAELDFAERRLRIHGGAEWQTPRQLIEAGRCRSTARRGGFGGCGGFGPEMAALPRIGGRRHAPATPRIQLLPCHGLAVGVEGAERRERGGASAVVAAHRRQQGAVDGPCLRRPRAPRSAGSGAG